MGLRGSTSSALDLKSVTPDKSSTAVEWRNLMAESLSPSSDVKVSLSEGQCSARRRHKPRAVDLGASSRMGKLDSWPRKPLGRTDYAITPVARKRWQNSLGGMASPHLS